MAVVPFPSRFTNEESTETAMCHQACTAEFKELAVKRVTVGQAIVATAKDLGLNEQPLGNWVKAAAHGA